MTTNATTKNNEPCNCATTTTTLALKRRQQQLQWRQQRTLFPSIALVDGTCWCNNNYLLQVLQQLQRFQQLQSSNLRMSTIVSSVHDIHNTVGFFLPNNCT